MEARTPPLARARAAALQRAYEAPDSQTEPAVSGWRERLRLLAAIAVTAMAGVSCMLGLSWLAVVSSNAGGQASAGLEPWAIGCALLALVAFAAGLAALLRPRARVALVAVASFSMILLMTMVIGFTMSGTPKEVDVQATEVIRNAD